MKNIIYVSTVLILFSSGVQTVHARGFLAGLAKDIGLISENQRRTLDNVHTALGNPLDHAAEAAVDSYIPGAGTALKARRLLRQQSKFGRSSQRQRSPSYRSNYQTRVPQYRPRYQRAQYGYNAPRLKRYNYASYSNYRPYRSNYQARRSQYGHRHYRSQYRR